MENDKATILWDSQLITDRQISCNTPDIVIQEKDSDSVHEHRCGNTN